MMRRLVVLVAVTALVVLAAAPAVASDQTFEVTVNPTATLNQFKTELTVSGTYTCDGLHIVVEFSGFGGEVIQSQKGGKIVVSGGFGIPNEGMDLVCDGTEKTFDQVVEARTADGELATWKRGRVIINGGGAVSDGTEEGTTGDGFLLSVKITK